MSRVMYFDCFSGAAGDMVLAALIDAGLPPDELRRALGSLGVGHELRITRVQRAGISATHVAVLGDDAPHSHGGHEHKHDHKHDHEHEHGHHQDHGHPHEHGHSHDHSHSHSHDHDHAHALKSPDPQISKSPISVSSGPHVHRTVAEIAHLIDHSALSEAGKARAVAMFHRLAEAEAAIHDMPVDQVHLHEVGAIDSIIDIVGVVFALEWFGIDDIVASPLNVGGGSIEIAHGRFPVPAPATLRLLAGVPSYGSNIQAELVTPTGALVVSTYAKTFGPMPAMRVARIGYGAGTRDLGRVPNVLRVVVGERESAQASAAAEHDVVKIECELDDMNPQLFGPVSDRLFAAGALDVFLTAVMMKKGRPGTLLTVLAPPASREALSDVLFRETTTIGVRYEQVHRETLDRQWVEVATAGGPVRIKVAGRRGETLSATPEFDDCLRVAQATGRPVKGVQAEAMRAWLDRDRH